MLISAKIPISPINSESRCAFKTFVVAIAQHEPQKPWLVTSWQRSTSRWPSPMFFTVAEGGKKPGKQGKMREKPRKMIGHMGNKLGTQMKMSIGM